MIITQDVNKLDDTTELLRISRETLEAAIPYSEILQTDPICISLVQGIQAHLNELKTRLRLLSKPDSVTKES